MVWNMNFIFPYVGNFIIPTDYFSEGLKPPNLQKICDSYITVIYSYIMLYPIAHSIPIYRWCFVNFPLKPWKFRDVSRSFPACPTTVGWPAHGVLHPLLAGVRLTHGGWFGTWHYIIYIYNYIYSWVNQLFLWPCSISNCLFTRGYP